MDLSGGAIPAIEVSDVLSAVAVLVALVALSLQLVTSRWERPVVRVTGVRYTTAGGPDNLPNRLTYRITVTNFGERPVSILSAGWQTLGANHSNNMKALLVPHSEFPVRLEPYDTKTWHVSEGFRLGGNEVDKPFIQLVHRPSFLDHFRGEPRLPIRRVYGQLSTDLVGIIGDPSAF